MYYGQFSRAQRKWIAKCPPPSALIARDSFETKLANEQFPASSPNAAPAHDTQPEASPTVRSARERKAETAET
jgi:hypothetical protein